MAIGQLSPSMFQPKLGDSVSIFSTYLTFRRLVSTKKRYQNSVNHILHKIT